jgi:hypothetical protein
LDVGKANKSYEPTPPRTGSTLSAAFSYTGSGGARRSRATIGEVKRLSDRAIRDRTVAMTEDHLAAAVADLEAGMPSAWRQDQGDDGRRCDELNRELLAYRLEVAERRLAQTP